MKKLLLTLSLTLLLALPAQAFAAISYEEAEGRAAGNSTNPELASVEGPTNPDGILICSILAEANGTTVTAGPAFGGNNFTQLGPYLDTDDGAQSYSIWYLVNPSTSSGNVTSTISNSTPWTIWCDTWSGVKQTATFGDQIWGVGALGTPLNVQRTASTTGSWQFLAAKEDSAATAITISAGGSRREVGQAGTVTSAHFDSNLAIDSGNSNTMTIDWTGGAQRIGYISAMMAPAPAAAAGTGYYQDLIFLDGE